MDSGLKTPEEVLVNRESRNIHESEVYILPFKFKHLTALQEMHAMQGKPNEPGLTMRDLPKIGFIAFLGKSPVAAGFLRRVEPNLAQLDTFVTNPFFGSLIRHDGILKVWEALKSEAKDLNLKGIITFSVDQGIIAHAKAEGFAVINQTLLAKLL